jgi:hypothetical protein
VCRRQCLKASGFFAMSGNWEQLVFLVNCGKLESGYDALVSLL